MCDCECLCALVHVRFYMSAYGFDWVNWINTYVSWAEGCKLVKDGQKDYYTYPASACVLCGPMQMGDTGSITSFHINHLHAHHIIFF